MDPRFHARRDQGDRQERRSARTTRARSRDLAVQHLPPPFPSWCRDDRGARWPPPLHGLGRADPDRLRRLPGLLAPRHDRRPRRRGRHLPFGLRRRPRALHARARGPRSGRARLRHRHVPRRLSAGRRHRRRAGRSGPPDDALGAASETGPARPRPAPVRHRPGRHGSRAPPPVDRRDRRGRLRRLRARRARDRRASAADVRGDRHGRRASPAGPRPATSWASATRRASSR